MTTLLAVAAATGTLLLGAPLSRAATIAPPCTDTGPSTVCQSPGNVQLSTHQAPVQFHPYGDLPGPPIDNGESKSVH